MIRWTGLAPREFEFGGTCLSASPCLASSSSLTTWLRIHQSVISPPGCVSHPPKCVFLEPPGCVSYPPECVFSPMMCVVCARVCLAAAHRLQVQGYFAHKKSPLPWETLVGLCLVPYGSPRGWEFFYERGTLVSTRVCLDAARRLRTLRQVTSPQMSRRSTPAEQWSQRSGSNVIPRRARPGLAGLRPHTARISVRHVSPVVF